MQWIKQTYACRYNVYDGCTGHIWGDRYWSKMLEGEPPEEEIAAGGTGRGDCAEERAKEGGQIPTARPHEGLPDGDSHGEGEKAENIRLPLDFPRNAAP